MKKRGKRIPVRDTGSIYSDSTISIQTIEFPATLAQTLTKKRSDCKFEPKSPRKKTISLENKLSNDIKSHRHRLQGQSKLLKPVRKPQSKSNESITNAESSPTDTQEAFKLFHRKFPIACPETDPGDLRHRYVGKCPNKDMIREKSQPYDKLKQVNFTRTENARNTYCLKNPNYRKNIFSKLTEETCIKENVKLADNVESLSEDQNTEEEQKYVEIDLDNPFNLDFHGFDYQNTFKNDEQNIENIREYRKIKRYANRIQQKRKIETLCKEEDEIKKFSVPEYFNTNIAYDSNGEAEEILKLKKSSSEASQSDRIGQLYRTEKKPINRFTIEKEIEQRFGRYRHLITRIKERDEVIEKAKKEATEIFNKNKILNIADKTFNKLYVNEPSTIKQKEKNIQIQVKKKTYPHALVEVKQFRHKMKTSKLIDREKGKLRENFLNNLGSSKQIEEAHLSISDLSESQTTITEKSSNDNDNLKTGQKNDKYHLRGFQFRFGNEIRGKYSITDKPPEIRLNKKGCVTRDEWINSLIPQKRKEVIYRRNPPQILKTQDLNHSNLCLFPPKPVTKSDKPMHPIREEIAKPFGNQYKSFVKKTIQIKKPKILKVKKFNLTNFIFGDEKSRMQNSVDSYHFDRSRKNFGSITEYIRNKRKFKDNIKRQKRRQRMHYLGISNPLKSSYTSAALCIKSTESEDSDWIPKQYKQMTKINSELISKENLPKSNCSPFVKNFITEFDYMPAPKFREPTIRRDPNNPRDLKEQVSESVILEAEYTPLPYLKAPVDDKNIPMRLDEPKKDFMKFLNARRHHDHCQATQHKDLKVLYKPKYPKPNKKDDTIKPSNKSQIETKKSFKRATPSNIKTRDIDYSLPLIRNEELNAFNKERNVTIEDEKNKYEMTTIQYPNIPEEYCTRSRPLPDYAGREEFLQLIKDINIEIKRQEKETRGKAGAEDEAEKMEHLLNKDKFMQQLKDELKSIKSCLSSLDSSICTNFTDDSGSFLIATDKKVPMDYIRKSIIPFEETNRTRIRAEPISQHKIETNPYKTVPFAGQKAEQLMKIEDKFHTFTTRVRNDIRNRLYIPTVNMSKKKLGIGNCKKYNPKFATDLDEIYIQELHNRPPTKMFRRSSIHLIKDALRKKYVDWCIQQKIIEQRSAEEKQLFYYNSVQKMKNLFTDLFYKWQKTYYDDLKEIECKIEPNYLVTDKLRKNIQEFEKEFTIINMNIIYIEKTLTTLTVLQNFHYLLMDEKWRRENDWLHKNENGILENYRESIEKRPFINLRKRDRDDVWAIKEFYEKDFINCQHPIIICLPDADTFNLALSDLKSKTYIRLLKLHSILLLHTNLEHQYSQVLIWGKNCNQQREEIVEARGATKTFMQKRGKELQNETQDLIYEPLAESVASKNFRTIKAFGEVLFEKLVPWSIRQSIKEDIDIKDQIALISDSLLDLLAQVDEIPKKLRDSTIFHYRRRLKCDTSVSVKAVETENRIATSMNTVQRLLQPIELKTRPNIMAKYGRMKLKKRRETEIIQEEPIPDKIHFFHKAFHDAKNLPEITKESQIEIENNLAGIEEEGITFDFDHFLRLNGYEPNYNFKTQIEITDGPEENYFKYKDLIPYVKQQVAIWDEMRKLKIKKHIEENPHLYTDVKN